MAKNKAAIDCNCGAVVMRGRNRAYAPGDKAFILCWAVKATETIYALPVVWRDDRWRSHSDGKGVYIPYAEQVTAID